MVQYIYFEVMFGEKVLDGGILTVNRYDPANPEDGKTLIEYISEYVVPWVSDPETVERGEIKIRYREMTEKEYKDILEENDRVMRGDLPYV